MNSPGGQFLHVAPLNQRSYLHLFLRVLSRFCFQPKFEQVERDALNRIYKFISTCQENLSSSEIQGPHNIWFPFCGFHVVYRHTVIFSVYFIRKFSCIRGERPHTTHFITFCSSVYTLYTLHRLSECFPPSNIAYCVLDDDIWNWVGYKGLF